MEKVPKRLRPFLEPAQKYKHRLGALLSYFGTAAHGNRGAEWVESASEAELQRTYKELSDALVTFVVETFNLVLERLNVDREYHGKFERALNGDLEERFKVPMLLERVLRYLRAEVPLMGQCDQLVNIIRSLLHPGNHPVLRREGMRLLMLWLRDESSTMPEIVQLFASCIPLQLFAPEGVIVQQPTYPLAPENEPPLFPAPPGHSPAEDALALLAEMLDFITFDVDADRGSTGLLYRLFREHYLTIMYPTVCRRVGLIESTYGRFVAGCPPELQAVVMRYYAMWTVQSPELFARAGGAATSIPVATFILQDLLLSSARDLELIHEAIGQALQLPFTYKTTIGIAIGVMRTWIFNPRERLPVFLQGLPAHPPTRALCEREAIRPDEVLDWYLQRYMSLIGGLFDGRPALGRNHEQITLYREGIYFLRGVAMSAFFTLSRASWDQLLNGTLLAIVKTHLADNPNKYAIIANPETAEDFSQLLAETLFGAWIRSETMVQGSWERLATVLGASTRWSLVVEEWSRTLITLTALMAEVVFGVGGAGRLPTEEQQQQQQPPPQLPAKKRQVRSGTFESAQLAALLAMGTPIGRAMSAELANPMAGRPFVLATAAADRPTDHFLAWSGLPWVRDNVAFLWRNMLRALGDINAIERPDIHESALTCIVQVFERLLAIRDMQPYFCRPLPPLYESALVLLDACDLPPKTYERSRCLAFSAVCRMFIRRQDMAFPDHYVPRFYLALVNGLADKDDPAATVILLCASSLFGRRLPGSAILVPPLLKCMAGMLNSQIPMERSGVLVPMMRMVQTIGIDPVTVPRIEAPLPIMSAVPISCAGEMGAGGVRMQVKDLLFMMDLQDGTRSDPPTHSVMLSVVTVLLCDELLVERGANATLVDGYLNVLLDHMLPKDAPLLSVVLDQLYALAQMLPLLGDAFGLGRQTMVVQRLVMSISTTAGSAELSAGEQDELLARLVQMLLEWLMALPAAFLTQSHTLREQVFAAIDECLRRRGGPIAKSHSALMAPPSPKKERPGTGAESDVEPDDGSLAREAAEFALLHLAHHMHNFAPAFGPTVTSSLVPDAGDERVLYFSLDESAVLAVQQVPGLVRVTVRNAAGRFTWDAQSFYETFQQRESDGRLDGRLDGKQLGRLDGLNPLDKQLDKFDYAHTIVERIEPYKPPYLGLTSPRFDGVPVCRENVDLERTDMLRELLVYLGKEHPHCVGEDRPSLVDVVPVAEARAESVGRVAEQCRRQTEAEQAVAEGYLRWEHHTAVRPARPKPAAPLPPYQLCRQFLAQYGFLAPVNGEVPLRVLAKTSGMMRDLKGLDAKLARELVKIGVLYVAPEQEDEASILRNAEGSQGYQMFLRTLGWPVDLATHPAYAGGLEPGMVVDNRALYYCSSTVECVFHDATALLVPPADERMLAKKRHIGNDHVHIVWNEHYRDYRPVMRGDYGNVQIVITPLEDAFYRVVVLRDLNVPLFGPIIDGMVLPRALLGTLVRATAINAHRAVMSVLRGAHHPLAGRARDISLIVRRHAQRAWTLEQFLAYVMFAAGLPEERKDDMRNTAELMERMTLDFSLE